MDYWTPISPTPPRETSLPKHTLDFYKSSNNSFTRSDRPFMKPSHMQPLTMARFITHQSQEFLGLNQSPYEWKDFWEKSFFSTWFDEAKIIIPFKYQVLWYLATWNFHGKTLIIIWMPPKNSHRQLDIFFLFF